MHLAALSLEVELKCVPGDANVPVSHRRQPERSVVARIFLVPNANVCRFEQANHDCKHMFARVRCRGQIDVDSFPDSWKECAEFKHPIELGFVAHRLPARMVAILFATTRIPTRGLNVTGRIRRDPHILPGGWNCQCRNALT